MRLSLAVLAGQEEPPTRRIGKPYRQRPLYPLLGTVTSALYPKVPHDWQPKANLAAASGMLFVTSPAQTSDPRVVEDA